MYIQNTNTHTHIHTHIRSTGQAAADCTCMSVDRGQRCKIHHRVPCIGGTGVSTRTTISDRCVVGCGPFIIILYGLITWESMAHGRRSPSLTDATGWAPPTGPSNPSGPSGPSGPSDRPRPSPRRLANGASGRGGKRAPLLIVSPNPHYKHGLDC